ncbi:hypothetical protein [Nonomuraea sp. NPDC003201]
MTDDDIDRLVSKLDLEQKARLVTGASVWRTGAEPDIGLRAMVFSDGPAGVRGEGWDERDTSLTLPCPTAPAATWDERLVGGRHFECSPWRALSLASAIKPT